LGNIFLSWNEMRFLCIDRDGGICSHEGVKSSLPLILAITAISLSLTACNTLSNRRDLYSPEKQHGPWTDKLNNPASESSNGKVRPVNQ
jgi:hypothetical protein